MNMLANLKTDATIAPETDSVGGSILESGLYHSKITLAYLITAASEAVGVVFGFKTSTGRDINSTIYVTSGKEKGCKNYYEKDGEKHYLPGFLLANSVAQLTLGKELGDLTTEEKVIAAYSKEAKAEVPTKVNMLTDLIGQEVIVGLIKQTVDKNQKNDQGKYVPTGETREENEIDKIFEATTKRTTAEVRAKADEGTFIDVWDAKWTGKTRNKAKGATGNGGTAGAPKGAAAGTKKPATSLFA